MQQFRNSCSLILTTRNEGNLKSAASCNPLWKRVFVPSATTGTSPTDKCKNGNGAANGATKVQPMMLAQNLNKFKLKPQPAESLQEMEPAHRPGVGAGVGVGVHVGVAVDGHPKVAASAVDQK